MSWNDDYAVVLMSGGVESTATLDWAVKKNYKKLIAVHSMWTDIEITGSREFNPNIQKICDWYNVPLYTYKQSNPLEGLDIEGIDYVHSSNHWLLTAMNIASRYPTIKNFLWGVNNGIRAVGDSGGDFPFLPRSWQFTIAFDQYVHNMGKDGGQRLWPPCSFMTKLQMWETIPDEVKPLVQSCGRPLKYDGVSPCGECFKCNEFKTMLDGVTPKP